MSEWVKWLQIANMHSIEKLGRCSIHLQTSASLKATSNWQIINHKCQNIPSYSYTCCHIFPATQKLGCSPVSPHQSRGFLRVYSPAQESQEAAKLLGCSQLLWCQVQIPRCSPPAPRVRVSSCLLPPPSHHLHISTLAVTVSWHKLSSERAQRERI